MRRLNHVPLVYVVILNWNGQQHLDRCIPTVLQSYYPNFRILVVDNGSTDNSIRMVQQQFPQVELLVNNANLGFAAGNNRGIRRALSKGADFVMLLNNDTRVQPDWLDVLIDVAERKSEAALFQARQRTWDGTSELRFRFIPPWAEAWAELHPISNSKEVSPTPFASGCAMLLRAGTLEDIGLFDKRYFMYVEDVDISLRAWIAGYQVLDVPAAVVYHRVSASAMSSRQRMYWGYRNQLTTILKLYEVETLSRYSKTMSRRWLQNRWAWRSTADALRMLPSTLSLRRPIQGSRRLRDHEFLDLAGYE